MTINLCRLLGHRRDKKRVRPYLGSWRSSCARCGIPMVRDASGEWMTAPKLGALLRPGADAGDPRLTRFPTARERDLPSKSAVPAPSAIEDLTCANDLSAPTPADRSAALGNREYFIARGVECRRLAAAAADRSIELIHLDLATRYDLLARDASDEPRHLHAVG